MGEALSYNKLLSWPRLKAYFIIVSVMLGSHLLPPHSPAPAAGLYEQGRKEPSNQLFFHHPAQPHTWQQWQVDPPLREHGTTLPVGTFCLMGDVGG